jgi:ubiquinone/menaquinone biosynthesis C-methylase UbiE
MLKLLYKWWIRLRSSSLKPCEPEQDELAYSEWEFAEGKLTWERFFANRVDVKGKKLIDVGCGLGGKTAFYATLGPKEAIGIDILEDNIAKAVEFGASKGLGDVLSFKCADATDLPFHDASFDIAISDDSFEHYPNPEGILNEVGRIVKPGGLFVIDFAQWGTPAGHHLQRWIKAPWVHLTLPTDEILGITREIGERQIASVSDLEWRDKLKDKLEWDLKHHREFLNRISIAEFEKLVSKSGVWVVRYERRTAASPWLYPFKALPQLREYSVGRNIYILKRVKE